MSAAGRVHCEDWRAIGEADLAPLYQAECRRWCTTIGWDFAPSRAMIERARRDGQLPGLVARRRGRTVAGWSYFVRHDARLQIGGLVGDDDACRRALLRAAVASPEAADARGVSCFLYPQSPMLQRLLEQEQFEVERHRYMVLELAEAASWPRTPLPSGIAIGPFADREGAALVHLMARAYEGKREATCFAPDLRRDQWAHYLEGLIGTPACGEYLSDVSCALRDADGRLIGSTIVTRIGEDTAHLAQIVVDPDRRGQALGRRLVQATCDTLLQRRYRRLTLLVAESNNEACGLYRRSGFKELTAFLHGTRAAR